MKVVPDSKMKKNVLKTLLFLAIIITQFLPSVESQNIEDLRMIQEARDSLTGSDPNTSPIDYEDVTQALPNQNIENTDINVEEVDDYVPVEFGFTGSQDLLVAPKPKPNDLDKDLRYFGYDYFNNVPSTFAPLAFVPVPSDYVIGPGDEIRIILFGNTNNKYNLKVTRDGDIYMPEFGPVLVAGLTFTDLKDSIQQLVSNQLIGTQVSVTLGELRSIEIYVLGEAKNPGAYTVGSLSNLINVIFASGGIRQSGSLRNIQLKRSGKIVSNFDLYSLLLEGDTGESIRLMQGDVVFIPSITQSVAINGEIQRPGIYELLPNEDINDLIHYAGNFTSKANQNSIDLKRVDQEQNAFKLINLSTKSLAKNEKFTLISGDVVTIGSVVDKLFGAILISGHASRPGYYPWFSGMRLSDVIASEKDLLPMVDLNYLLIKREIDTTEKYVFLQSNLKKLFAESGSKEDLVLQDRDQLIFFPSLLSTELIELYDGENIGLFGLDINDEDDEILIEQAEDDALLPDRGFLNQQRGLYQVYNYCYVTKETLESITLFPENKQSLELTRFCRNYIKQPLLDIAYMQSDLKSGSRGSFEIYGNILFPGTYPYTLDAELSDIIDAGGGFMSLTVIDDIEITRNSIEDNQIKESFVGSLTSINVNKQIQPMDVVTVKGIDTETQTVKISGQVRYPGVYPIQINESLVDIVKRAGGIKPSGDVNNIFFRRASIVEQQRENIIDAQNKLNQEIIALQATSNTEDEDYSNRLLSLTQNMVINEEKLGRLVFDYSSILSRKDDDIFLKDGDEINVPRTVQTVNIIGEVQSPQTMIFRGDASFADYIESSGGLNSYADIDSAYIIRGNGKIIVAKGNSGFFRSNTQLITPGDTIVVPIKLDKFDTLRTTSQVTQMIYQMALAAAAVNSF